ncbi:hypothetical protein NKJ74_26990 [Mesorhizobium sp. M0046]|uniref:hypothetical protein n=1 Tax=Mesorhizobium sp. M0046 TaxID=2956858 RepID=UPI00333E10DD
MAIGKLCARLQVPKPPRGYWARVKAGQMLRRPPLAAFREELETRRLEAARERAAESLSKLQREFYLAALTELSGRGIDVRAAHPRGSRLPDLDPDLAAQILLLIQGRAQDWVEEGRIATRWGTSVQSSATGLVEQLLPSVRAQLLVFETEGTRHSYVASGPVIFVRLTAQLQERIAMLARMVRDQKLQHVVMPLTAADHAWSAHHLHGPDSQLFLDSWLCVSASEIWIEWSRKAWREEDPPERFATGRIGLRDVMPIDVMPVREAALSPVISAAKVKPYHKRLCALLEAERVHEMMSRAAYEMEREVPGEILAVADRIWFGEKRPFQTAREAWRHLEDKLERWETELEAERSDLARSILGIGPGDIVTWQSRGQLLQLSVIGTSLYPSDGHVTFVIQGMRFRKDGTLGKLHETLTLSFKDEGRRRQDRQE